MYQILRAKNRGAFPETLEFARQLVATPSPTLHEAQVAQCVEERMRQLGFDAVTPDDAGNIVGVMLGRDDGPTVLLTGHMDTAERAGEANDQEVEPGVVRDGRLHGPGSSDCKAGIAAQIYAAALLKRSLLPLKGNLVFAATVAEEKGDSVGVRTLMSKTLPDLELYPDYAVLGEPTGLGLYYGHDGWMEVEVRVEGVNQFQVEDAALAIQRDFERRDADASAPRRLIVHGPAFDEADDGRGICRARMQVDRRLGVEERADDVLQQVRHNAQLLAGNGGAVAVDVALRQTQEQLYTGSATMVRRIVKAWSTDPFSTLMDRARQALAAADCPARTGKWELGRFGMGTAGSVLVNEFNVPTVGYGPGGESEAHAPGEYVPVENIKRAAYGTAAIVHALIGVPVFGWSSDEI